MERRAPDRSSPIRVSVVPLVAYIKGVLKATNSTAHKSQIEALSYFLFSFSRLVFFFFSFCFWVFGSWVFEFLVWKKMRKMGRWWKILVIVTDKSPWSFKNSSFLKLMPIFPFLLVYSFLVFGFRFQIFKEAHGFVNFKNKWEVWENL